jgi:predicted P-loop ATPase
MEPEDAAQAPGGNEDDNPENGLIDVRPAAAMYAKRGWSPIPLRPKSKAPVHQDWRRLVVTATTKWPGNIGVCLGKPSAGLVDLDLDCPEAIWLAPAIMPPTSLAFGRPSKPRSHWLYDCGETAPAKASTGTQFAPGFGDEKTKDKPLLEIRSTGGQTMFPPSVHPEGERLEWSEYNEPAQVNVEQLMRAAALLAGAALLLRHFPGPGGRWHGYKAVIGWLLRSGVSPTTAEEIVRVFADHFSPARLKPVRMRSVRVLRRRLAERNGPVPGYPELVKVFGSEAAKRAQDWLLPGGDWHRGKKGEIIAGSLHNMQLALARLDARLRYDEFADHLLLTVGSDPEQRLEDPQVHRLWFRIEEEFGFSPSLDRFRTFLSDAAWQNRFHPVRDYLDGLRWDGVQRLDDWLFRYGGATTRTDAEGRPDESRERYIRAVGRLMLVAAVRRVRQPGVKFDEMLVFINETQGTDKSTALAILARRPEWFTDSVDVGMDDKQVIEQTRGKWIAEVPELRGRRRSDVDKIKAFLSRQYDRARLAYGHFQSEVGRSFVPFGTTNDVRFLIDRTGNRRFWPVVGIRFDVETLQRDVDQLWAEAVAAEAAGDSIRLDKELWPTAEEAQAESLIEDPWVETLGTALGDWPAEDEGVSTPLQGKIRGAAVWILLGMDNARRNQSHNERMGAAMRQLGWTRPKSSIRFGKGHDGARSRSGL